MRLAEYRTCVALRGRSGRGATLDLRDVDDPVPPGVVLVPPMSGCQPDAIHSAADFRHADKQLVCLRGRHPTVAVVAYSSALPLYAVHRVRCRPDHRIEAPRLDREHDATRRRAHHHDTAFADLPSGFQGSEVSERDPYYRDDFRRRA